VRLRSDLSRNRRKSSITFTAMSSARTAIRSTWVPRRIR
jgi:hypothetical protein